MKVVDFVGVMGHQGRQVSAALRPAIDIGFTQCRHIRDEWTVSRTLVRNVWLFPSGLGSGKVQESKKVARPERSI